MSEHTISVSSDFSETPGPRFSGQGDHSGESFRKRLASALREYDRVIVNLDGTAGYASSFLDEAFGGLVRSEGFTKEELKGKLSFISEEDESYEAEALEAIADAEPGSK